MCDTSIGLIFLIGCKQTDVPTICSALDVGSVAEGGSVTAGCYTLDEGLTITADAVLEEGVTIAIVVDSGGSLDARSTANNGVSLTGLGVDTLAGVHFSTHHSDGQRPWLPDQRLYSDAPWSSAGELADR